MNVNELDCTDLVSDNMDVAIQVPQNKNQESDRIAENDASKQSHLPKNSVPF